MGNRWSALQKTQKVALIAAIVIIVGGIATFAVTSSGSKATHVSISKKPQAITPVSVTTTTGLTVPAGNCPLTDVHAANGVPNRPPIAIKIGNEPGAARPQSGLNEADIVFDTPAEGFVMRYEAVYQCTDASRVGPNRSLRWVDWRLVRQMRDPILAYAGGIDPNINLVARFKWAAADNLLLNAGGAGIRTTDRSPPDNLYTSTQGLYSFSSAFVKTHGAPPPIFRYSDTPAATATSASSVHINFSYDTDVIWTWNAGLGEWIHSYTGGPDIDALTGSPVSTTNVVVLVVKYKFGTHSEHGCCSGDFESATTGKGAGYIFRNGKEIKVTWSRQFVTQPWTFIAADGSQVALAPGRTWVELLPNTTAAAKGAFTVLP